MEESQLPLEEAACATLWSRESGTPNQNTRTVHSQGAKLWPKEPAILRITIPKAGRHYGADQQASVICKTSMLFAEQTLSNTFDVADKLKEPQELLKIQSDFVSRQAQLVGDQTKELGQKMAELNDVTKPTLDGAAEHARPRFKAA